VYEAYWELSEPPFENSPNPKFFYLSPEHEEALVRLVYVVTERKGCGMLTGDYGCGKTTLARALLQRLDGERYEVGLLTNPCWSPLDFLREVLYQLGVEAQDKSPDKGKPELLHLLNDVFYRNYRAGKDTVIIVDEAQMIDDEAIFEELRLLSNFQTDERFLMTLLLIGSTELREKVRRVRHLDQRIAIRYHLNALDGAHTANYIAHRLKMAGQTRRIFTDEAVKLVFDFTRGTPREINNLCDLSLLIGYGKRVREIDEKIVAEVIKDTVGVS
jgi:general secretion pathway protein A